MVVMAHGLNALLKRTKSENKTGIGSRRIFPPQFKLQVLDSYRNDNDCKGNQRATARKYGIHRRQIQKWLQAENNLRNSVGKGGQKESERKCGIELALGNGVVGPRQRDDAAPDAYSVRLPFPALSPIAYSETTAAAAARPPTPLDFANANADPSAPMDLSLKKSPAVDPRIAAPVYLAPQPTQPPARLAPTSPPLLHHQSSPSPDIWDLSTRKRSPSPVNKPVKLFKPYLDDLHENSNSSEDSQKQKPPTYETHYYINNNIYEFNTYIPEIPTFLPKYYPYEESYLSPYPLKQRQSYSVDFKLRAIECYYRDEFCKGNQRAVATKYNIHRRQVQKWLQQEDELREKNESTKLTIR